MRAAMVGGAGYAAGKRRAQAQEAEVVQGAGMQRAQAAQQAPAQGVGGGMSELDRLDALKKLGDLHDSGVLTDVQFEAEREKLL